MKKQQLIAACILAPSPIFWYGVYQMLPASEYAFGTCIASSVLTSVSAGVFILSKFLSQ